MDPTWIVRLDAPGDGPRLAVKDCIDVEGLPTTAGCQVVAEQASPAAADAPVVAAARRARARIVGKTSLTELCWSASGVNPWLGTPENPTDPRRVPGGSSSGSAVAIARGEADAALGTDTGGSVRIPAACCGIVGLQVCDVTGFDFRPSTKPGTWPSTSRPTGRTRTCFRTSTGSPGRCLAPAHRAARR
jgi:amidase